MMSFNLGTWRTTEDKKFANKICDNNISENASPARSFLE
jgi:hypothetical protein